MGDGGRELISVRFTSPVEGVDPTSGEVVVSTQHRVAAVYVRQDRTETLFVNDEGEVVARWATRLVEGIDWSGETTQTPALEPSVGTLEWRKDIQDRHRHAYHAWTAEEEAQLTQEFHNGLTVAEMADGHERRPGGIMARLVRLRLIAPDTHEGQIGRPPPARPAPTAGRTEPPAPPEQPEQPEPPAIVEVADDVCRHELAIGTCSICRYDGRPDVHITAGGSHYHAGRDCPALLDGQRRIENQGGTTEPIETVRRGSARLEGRDPCLRCAQE